ncbi:MAG TPA: hemerythrin domain-containing protein [Polyangia bacterium]
MGPLRRYMTDDHARLDALLAASTARADAFDADAFERFRAGLLRHIGIEEKILLSDARARRGGEPLPLAARLRVEHAAIASLMVPTPDAALAAELRGLLDRHNALEEGDGGLYDELDALAGSEAERLLERARAAAEPPVARHFDGAGVMRTAADALALAERNAERVAARKKDR